MNTKFLYVIVALVAFSSCRQANLYETHTQMKNFEWNSATAATGSFNITDTTALYKLFVVLRHEDAYNFNNIWLNVALQQPGDSLRYQRLEIPLGNDAEGWFGTGMNNIWEMRYQLTQGPQRFAKPGIYNYSLVQLMREDPLKHVLSAGLRVEKLN